MKQVSVIGGGVSGMSAAIAFAEAGYKVDIYTTDFGGDYLKGGLKYLHYTNDTLHWIKNVLKMRYSIHRVNGAIFWENEIHAHPEWFWHLAGQDIDPRPYIVQEMYWKKTRGNNIFQKTCMNEPWKYRTELKIEPNGGIGTMVGLMIDKVQSDGLPYRNISTRYATIEAGKLKEIIRDSEYVVYTIPIDPLAELMNIKINFEYRPLNIIRYKVHSGLHRTWWDYIYVPSEHCQFHRMSFLKLFEANYFDLELNGDSKEGHIKNMADGIFQVQAEILAPNLKFGFDKVHQMKIKGHLTGSSDLHNRIPKNVFLLGRYAQLNPRVTFDKVLERLFHIIKGDLNDEKR